MWPLVCFWTRGRWERDCHIDAVDGDEENECLQILEKVSTIPGLRRAPQTYFSWEMEYPGYIPPLASLTAGNVTWTVNSLHMRWEMLFHSCAVQLVTRL
jgi:hypothetical protein